MAAIVALRHHQQAWAPSSFTFSPFSLRRWASSDAGLGKGFDVLAEVDEDDSSGKGKKMYILGYDGGGFEVGDINMRGSIIALPRSVFLWKPRKFEDITLESLSLIPLLKPPVELLLIGSGPRLDRPLPKELVQGFTSKGIVVEQMDTMNACATFNILNQEDRSVAAAILCLDQGEGETEE